MTKRTEIISIILKYILYIGFFVQIFLGILWAKDNFLVCHYYEDRIEFLSNSPVFCFVYVLQCGFALFAAWSFLGSLRSLKIRHRILGSLAIVTAPFCLQCHFATNLHSILSSCMLLELSVLIDCMKDFDKLTLKNISRVLMWFVIAGILKREYIIFGFIPVVIIIFLGFLRNKSYKYYYYSALLVAAAIGIVSGSNVLLGDVFGYSENKSIELSLLSRCAWPYLDKGYEQWPEDVKEIVSDVEAYTVNFNSSNIYEFGEKVESKLGKERAKEAYLSIAALNWSNNKTRILHDTTWDTLGYMFSPLVVKRQLDGKIYESYSSSNYIALRENSGIIARYYVTYGMFWYGIALICYTLLFNFRDKDATKKVYSAIWCMLMIFCLIPSVYYSICGAGFMDYKKTIFVIAIFNAQILCRSFEMNFREDK